MSKHLYLVRGVSGAGKSTLADSLAYCSYSADDFFINEKGEYHWYIHGLRLAHKQCLDNAEEAMKYGINKVSVANTFVKARDMKPYIKLAEKYGYLVHSIIVENRHGGTNVHNVPEETLQRMENNFQVKLR